MAMTVGVRFRNNGKIYDFDPGEFILLPGEKVMVETARGVECGEVARANRENADGGGTPLKPVLRRANEEDLRRVEENARKEREAVRICQERIAAHGLEMKLVDAEYAFDNTKILFSFTAEGRVDFRDLVKDLAVPSAALSFCGISSRFLSRWPRNRVYLLTLPRFPVPAAG